MENKKGVVLYESHKEVPKTDIECVMQAGATFWIDSPVELKGRGITFGTQYTSKQLPSYKQYKVGWYGYRVTKRAYELLKQKYSIAKEIYSN